MTNTITLDELTEAANEKYSNLTIPLGGGKEAVFVNALQLSQEKRAELVKIQGMLEGDDADQVAILQDALRVAGSTTPKETAEVVEKVGDNLAILMELFVRYSKGTQAGEA